MTTGRLRYLFDVRMGNPLLRWLCSDCSMVLVQFELHGPHLIFGSGKYEGPRDPQNVLKKEKGGSLPIFPQTTAQTPHRPSKA